jgi:hypothetical protein
MNYSISAWLSAWSKFQNPSIKECYFCHGGIPPLDTPNYVLLDKEVNACWYCYKTQLVGIRKITRKDMSKLADSKTHRFRFEIPSSNGKKLYLISQQKSNLEWQCSCTGWIAHRKCKHLKSTEAERMKLEKSTFGAKNKDFNGPSGNPNAWKNVFNEAIPEPEVAAAESTVRKLKIKEEDK